MLGNSTGGPVVVVEIRKILVPVDFSEHSQRALDAAIGLAQKFGAEVHLLHCCHLDPLGAHNAPYDVLLPPSIDQTIQEAARGLTQEWARKAAERGLIVHPHLRTGAPFSEIADAADRIGADWIVMGTRGLSGFKHALLGSVAERTIRIAHCPVLTVKQDAAR